MFRIYALLLTFVLMVPTIYNYVDIGDSDNYEISENNQQEEDRGDEEKSGEEESTVELDDLEGSRTIAGLILNKDEGLLVKHDELDYSVVMDLVIPPPEQV